MTHPYSPPTSSAPIPATIERPMAVVIAIWLFAGSYAAGLLNALAKAGLPHTAGMTITISIAVGLLFAVYSRKNWARWITVVFVASGIVMLPDQISRLAEVSDKVIYAAQGVFQLAAVVLLFLPASGRWYRGEFNHQVRQPSATQ